MKEVRRFRRQAHGLAAATVLARIAMLLTGLLACSWVQAQTVFVSAPRFPAMFEELSALNYSSTVSAFVPGAVKSNVIPGSPFYPESWEWNIVNDDAVSVENGVRKAGAVVTGRAQFGNLGATGFAWAAHPFARGDGFVVVEYMDVLQANMDGDLLDFGFHVNGHLTSDTLFEPHNPSFGRPYAKAELYVLPYGPLPAFSTNITSMLLLYGRRDFTPEHGVVTTEWDQPVFEAGQRYWVYGRLEVGVVAQASSLAHLYPPHRVEATAEFMHTARLFIDGPEGAYSMASGFDYRSPVPVPEPTMLASMLAGLALVGWAARVMPGRSRRIANSA